MNRKMRFLWIDDDPDREEASDTLSRQLDLTCKFLDVQPKNVDIIAVIREEEPDLILIDHNLTEIGIGDIKKGSTLAAFIREKRQGFPIACITGQDKNRIDTQQANLYDAIFDLDNIKSHYSTMKSIAMGYYKLRESKPSTGDQLVKLMLTPPEEKIRLKTIMPHEIKEKIGVRGTIPAISDWIRNVFIERPGFLYDRLWAATILGLNEAGFKKVEPLFKAAKYKGLFADDSKERWWKTELIKILSKHVDSTELPWEKGRHLNNITPRHYSKDYYTNYADDFPETVAFVDDTSSDRYQMKLKYTVPHPKYDKLLFFEEIKMMKAD